MSRENADRAEPWQKDCMAILPNGAGKLAVCIKPGPWHAWLFTKHPDGQWVSVRKLDCAPMIPDGHPLAMLSATSSAEAISSQQAEGFRQALETISSLADDAPWANETGRIKRMGAIARVELERVPPSALSQQAEGWVLVPREPTPEMCRVNGRTIQEVWTAMLSAAPPAPTGERAAGLTALEEIAVIASENVAEEGMARLRWAEHQLLRIALITVAATDRLSPKTDAEKKE